MSDRAEWLDERLAAAGLRRTGDITCPHDRPWGTVHTAPTTGGQVWLKAPGQGTVFEVALYDLLSRVVPDRIPCPIAIDLDRGWVLVPDGGTTLGDAGTDIVDGLVAVLPQYGQLQRDLAAHSGALLSAGVADMRPEIMPDRFDEAMAAVGGLDHVSAMRDTYAEWCARLAESPVPASLDHNDLHPQNVFLDGDRARLYDWGDAVVAHPFASMLVTAAVVPDTWMPVRTIPPSGVSGTPTWRCGATFCHTGSSWPNWSWHAGWGKSHEHSPGTAHCARRAMTRHESSRTPRVSISPHSSRTAGRT